MPYVLVLFLLVAASIPVSAQTAPPNTPAPTATGADAVLADLKAANGLSVDTPHPWHLKARFELHSADRTKLHTGTFEEWWSGAQQSKKTWTIDGKTSSLYHDGSGSYLQGEEPPIALEYFLPKVFIRPVPSFSPKEKMIATESAFGGAKLRCIRPADSSQMMALAMKVCFDEQRPIVRWIGGSALQQTFNQILQFDGRSYLAREIEIAGKEGVILSTKLDIIETLAAWKPDLFLAPAGAAKVGLVSSEYEVSSPKPLKTVPPHYSSFARAERLQGTVVVAAIIAADGSIRKLEPIASAAPALTQAAVSAMHDWKYQPALDHGVPVETPAINTCNFYLGP